MIRARRVPLALLALGVALAAGGAIAVASSSYAHGSLTVIASALAIFLPFAVAAELRARYPDRLLGALLVAIGVAYFVRSLPAIDNSATYAPARALAALSDVLLVWLTLAFPSGKLQGRWSRGLVIAGAASVVLLWWAVIATSTNIPAGSVFVTCGSRCPRNGLMIANSPDASKALYSLFRLFAGIIVLSTVVVLADRLRRASHVMRRILAPVLLASILRLSAVAAYLAVGSTTAVRWYLLATYLCVPMAIVLGLLRGRSYDAAALERLVRGLRTRPGPDELRSVMALALRDPSLEIAYWLPEAQAYAGPDGLPVELVDDADRAVTRVAAADGERVAALTHDPALLDHPQLLDALSSTAALALETNRLEAAVAAARAGTITAVDAERRRIERDLHDGTQQRLIALRMKLSVAERILGANTGRAQSVLDELGGDIDSALAEVRRVSHGIAPPILVERGLEQALRSVAGTASLPVHVWAEHLARYPQKVETAVYYCCLEALQNIEKHAGDGVTADIRLSDDGHAVAFVVSDGGAGFDPGTVRTGAGFRNIQERVEELGGLAAIAGRPGGGTEVRGSIPLVV